MTKHALPGEVIRTDLRDLLDSEVLDHNCTSRWLDRQQLPVALRRLALERAAREFLAELWARLLDDLADGIVVTQTGEMRQVEIARTAVVRIDRRTQHVRGDIRNPAGTEEDVPIEVGQPFPKLLWLDAVLPRHAHLLDGVRNALLAASFSRNPAVFDHARWVDESLQPVVRWARTCVRRLLLRTLDTDVLRTRVHAAYALDPAFMDLVRRAGAAAGLSVPSRFWNQCLKHRHQLERVAEHGPGLLRLLGEAIEKGAIDCDAPPLAFLKQGLQRYGVTDSDWKRLLVDRAAPVWRLRDRQRLSRHIETGAHLAVWARIHRGLPHETSLPMSMWQVIAQGATEEMTSRLRVPNYFSIPGTLLRSAMAEAEQHRRAGTFGAFMETEWKPFVRSEPSRCRSWTKAIQKVRRETRLAAARAQAQSREPWPAPFKQTARENFVATLLATPLELHEEAIRMHHCADLYVDECRDDTARLFSVSHGEASLPVGTLALDRKTTGSPWKLADVKGPANSPVSPEVLGFAQFVAQAYADACRVAERAVRGIDTAEDEDCGDDDDDDDDCEDLGELACPICCCEENCETHLVASFDVEEGLLGGTLYDLWDQITACLKDRVLNACVGERRSTGLGESVDALLAQILDSDFAGRSQDIDATNAGHPIDTDHVREIFDEIWEEVGGGVTINAYVEEKLAELPDVEQRYYEVSTAPGLTWSGNNYFASDAAGSAAQLEALIRSELVA